MRDSTGHGLRARPEPRGVKSGRADLVNLLMGVIWVAGVRFVVEP